MKAQIFFVLATLALASGQVADPNLVNLPLPRVPNLGDSWSWLEGKISDGLDRAKQFGQWLVEPGDENYNPDGEKLSIAQRMARLKSSGANAPQLNFMEKMFKQGRVPASQINFIRMSYEAMGGFGSCVVNKEWTDPDLGHMPLNESAYCNIACGRMIPGLTCCQPAKPDVIDASLILFQRGQKGRALNWRDPGEASLFQSHSGRIVFVAHGFLEKISLAHWMTEMINGFHALGDTSVIAVDWRNGNGFQYGQSIANLRTVGAILGHAIGTWGIADRTLFVGFSLGGQMIGEVAGNLRRRFGQKLAQCHALDPAGPLFDGCSSDITLDKDDCQLTEVIHTSATDVATVGAAVGRYGTYKKSGNCDYWINCGYNQDPCLNTDVPHLLKGIVRLGAASDDELTNWISARSSCSHWRAPLVYISALARNATCPAYECPKCGKSHFCIPESVRANQADNLLPPFSRCTSNDNSNFYVASNSLAPYCVA